MKQTSNSNQPNNPHPWLQEVYNKKAERAFELGKQTIDVLEEGLDVTHSSVEKKSKELDPSGKGIHQNTIKSNPNLYVYYKENSKSYKRWASHKRQSIVNKEITATIEYSHIKLTRDLNTVRKRYTKMSKQALVERLIQAEQLLAEGFQGWLAEQFGAFQEDE